MNKFHYWLSWFNREKITLFIGSLIIAQGAIFPWYSLPKETLETFGTNLFWANAARIPIGLLAIIGFIFTFLLSMRRAPRLVFGSALILTLLFPYFIITWSPTVSFIASTYYNNAETISDHIDKNFSQVQAQWKQNISLAQPQAPPSIFEMSIEDSRFFQMPSWDKIILKGFGYKNSLFVFIGKGWGFSLIGLLISLFGLYLGLDKQIFHVFYEDLKLLIPGITLLLSVIFISLIGVNIANYRLDTQFAKGDYLQVVNTSKTLVSWYPPLQGDEAFLERLAKAEFYIDAPEADLINFVQGLELYKYGDFQKAEIYFQKSLNIKPARFLVRGYLASAILNQGINYFNVFNNKKPGAAADLFDKVLQIFPGHLEALYDLMLARVVNGEFQKSADTAKQIIEGQKYFQEPRIGLLGQAYVHLTWAEYNNGDVDKTWKRYRQSVDASTWNKFSVDE
jgi:tetratricopeptide (TPR) repeat protein